MKDYSFGNYICALRMGLGLSQFQLGTLVGVSDKAVSKWENGDAKPRISTCYRLAEVLGVSINELLSCNTTMPARKELNKMKTKLWNEASKRLSIYGETPPALCWSRLAAEKAALEETDAILSMAVLSMISDEAEKRNTLIFESGQCASSFTAWLLGASKINPLPPHYRCPKCGNTEFVHNVKDGFDLPAKYCTCGAEMIRDGHNLPYEGYARAAHTKMGVHVRVSFEFMPTASNIIKDFYQGKATILPVKYTDCEEDIACATEIYVVLTDREDVPPVSGDGFWHVDNAGFWHWWKDELMYELISDSRIQKIQLLQENTNTTLPNPLQHITPEMAEALYQKKCCDCTHTAASTKYLCQNLSHNFDLLLKLDGFTHATNAWREEWTFNGAKRHYSNGEKLVKEERATLIDIPAFREDIWNDVSLALARNGIRDNGLALQIMEDTRKGWYYHIGMTKEYEKMLRSLGLPEWYPEYLKKVMYLFTKGHCVSLVLLDIILEWYRENYPEAWNMVDV